MDKKNYLIAQELKRRLSAEINFCDFKVFGSRARGDNTEDSDMDIYIEVKELNRSIREKIFDITWQVGYEHEMVIAPIIVSTDEIIHSALRSSPIIRNIHEQGISI